MAEKFRLPNDSRVGPPILRVKDLDRMLEFYQGVFGLEQNRSASVDVVELGFGKEVRPNATGPLLVLKHDPQAKETSHDFAGLYHFAILVPDRKSLAYAYLGIQEKKVRFDGFGDHLVSESLYLHDPERNGIEIYRDRPRSEWSFDEQGRIIMDTIPLDLAGISSELPEQERNIPKPFPNGARIGHMHLRVTNLERSVEFYHEKLGFDVTGDWSSMGAMFLSAGGYHHHIGMNTWHSLDGKKHETGEAGLDSFTIELPNNPSTMRELKSRLGDALISVNEGELLASDPNGIQIRIKAV